MNCPTHGVADATAPRAEEGGDGAAALEVAQHSITIYIYIYIPKDTLFGRRSRIALPDRHSEVEPMAPGSLV